MEMEGEGRLWEGGKEGEREGLSGKPGVRKVGYAIPGDTD